ncbi:VOC family protein [Corynebacterium lowii]|uniref:Glyoxalase-like domain protein n=1 Tax=Corynebacterium lowii TaxID=1544413 RepID=A0A0Q0YIE9_9CORY|nr:VOC family protein [Corynebacterium lowii]KQB86453.1 Glyoxalase-like domain protein [Corynebacterium lowii]MDP9850937.1 putative lactoylglutathione lyase [Corynebacterium lowii]
MTERLRHDMVFINLPVADVKAAVEFYRALGFVENQVFRDESTASFEVSDHIVVMLLERERFASFHSRETVASGGPREALVCISMDSAEDVTTLVNRAREAGGLITKEPHEEGPMYGAAFDDPDGHGWELMWMDPEALANMG